MLVTKIRRERIVRDNFRPSYKHLLSCSVRPNLPAAFLTVGFMAEEKRTKGYVGVYDHVGHGGTS